MQELITELTEKYPTLSASKIERLAFMEGQIDRSKPSQPLQEFLRPKPQPVTMVSTLPRVEDASCDGCE